MSTLNLQEALQQEVRGVEIAHTEESLAFLQDVVERMRESVAAKDAAVLAAPPALVRDLQARVQLQLPLQLPLSDVSSTGGAHARVFGARTAPCPPSSATCRNAFPHPAFFFLNVSPPHRMESLASCAPRARAHLPLDRGVSVHA